MTTPSDARKTKASETAERLVNELFYTPEGRADPYPLYHALREARPVPDLT